MAAPAEVINKINALSPNDLVLVTDLVNHLSKSEAKNEKNENVFRKARKACKGHWMDEDQIDREVEAIKAERNASGD